MAGTLQERRRAHDKALREFTATMDVAAQDMRHKHDRAHFCVVGEGSRSAQDKYLIGYAAVDWHKETA